MVSANAHFAAAGRVILPHNNIRDDDYVDGVGVRARFASDRVTGQRRVLCETLLPY